ncbi:hypothetical protein B9Z19DRAFT_1083471 [Tuber borchii]|uniref:Uncharacterized protein n=1 Tax=Tuber borchii TaxID=42251 RepID=A0A2T6ZTB2_TUBBO|nr:hypothetical protein B9Z19DRAFT_1083471 [Tuber borchii]
MPWAWKLYLPFLPYPFPLISYVYGFFFFSSFFPFLLPDVMTFSSPKHGRLSGTEEGQTKAMHTLPDQLTLPSFLPPSLPTCAYGLEYLPYLSALASPRHGTQVLAQKSKYHRKKKDVTPRKAREKEKKKAKTTGRSFFSFPFAKVCGAPNHTNLNRGSMKLRVCCWFSRWVGLGWVVGGEIGGKCLCLP